MNKSEKFFDRTSSMSKPEPTRSASKVIELTKEYLDTEKCVLDFGCGSGSITNKFSKHVKKIEAIDFSKGMINVAKKQANDASIININYAQTSIFDESLAENTFDVIMSFNVLHYIEDMPNLLNRINSLLKPGGVFISSTACLKEKKNGIRLLMWLLSKMKIIPKTLFYKKLDLEKLIINGRFEIIKSEIISGLPEYFIVGEKQVN
ncbi:MAG: 2-polyprenyl-3-methyl-5-hydroxy-6-metoxy-1,4-benzoquinol methylase [Crocinitomix sp.]|jgi:2-polyprenyl-3-methyl-5-hydroxy-6-metoxy-1,4-benzoquinol methylase